MEEMGGQASAFRSTEEEVGGDWRQSRRNAEDASEACCPGWVGMEVGKGQQAQARKNMGGRILIRSGNEQHSASTAHYHNGPLR